MHGQGGLGIQGKSKTLNSSDPTMGCQVLTHTARSSRAEA